MMFELGDKKIGNDGLVWVLIRIDYNEFKIKLYWREITKQFLMSAFVTVNEKLKHIRTIELFRPDEVKE